MDVGSKFDRAELPLDDDEFDRGKKKGRGDGGGGVGDEDDGQGVAAGTEPSLTGSSSKVYSVFPFWIEASTPIINLYDDEEEEMEEKEDSKGFDEGGFQYDGAHDGFQYDGDYDLRRVTYYDYGRHESKSTTQQTPNLDANAEGRANPEETYLGRPRRPSLPHTKLASSQVVKPMKTSSERPKDRSSPPPTRPTLSQPTTTRHVSTTKQHLTTTKGRGGTTSATFFKSARTLSEKGQSQTAEITTTVGNDADSESSSPSSTIMPAMKLSSERSQHLANTKQTVGEIEDQVASTASNNAYEVYDYGEKEYGVNEGSLESDLLKLLDKIARRYDESAEGG